MPTIATIRRTNSRVAPNYVYFLNNCTNLSLFIFSLIITLLVFTHMKRCATMKTGRSKLMLKLVEESTQNAQITNFSHEKCNDEEDFIPGTPECHSPLPPGAHNIIENIMKDVYQDVFSDDIQETSEVIKSTDENLNPNLLSPTCDNREDPFMAVYQNASSPHLSPSENQNGIVSLNMSLPLTPLNNSNIISDLSPFPQPITSTVDNSGQTPMPSPAKAHGDVLCNSFFCPIHDDADYSTCPSINTVVSSCQSSPAPLMRCRGKKRIRNYDDWEEVKRKRLTNAGKEYSSKKGTIIPAKSIGKPCTCRHYKCYTMLTLKERQDAFKKFWHLGDREKQWMHIANYTTKEKKKRGLQRDLKHNRQFTYKYFLPKDSSKIEVCKIMFLRTYSISERVVRTAWDKYCDGSSLTDMRGKHKNHKKIVDDEMINSVRAHVNSFVPVESHYNRAASKRLYLDGDLSIARMFKLYKEWPELHSYSTTAFSLRQYRDIVHTNFNLSFHLPKKDTCDQCHSFKQTQNPSDDVREQYEKHLDAKKVCRTLKQSDKNDAIKSNGRIVCATFDFQKILSCPHGQMSVLYYKRKLSCYNFTIYDMVGKQGYCYMWDESVAKRGANEVASCVYDFIKKFVSKGVKEFRFWSDNCAGQNRNRIVFNMFALVAKECDITITHRFLEKGHTQNEGDSVHSVIERAAEHKTIYTPDEWKLLVRWAKVTGDSYEVIDVNQSLIFDFKDQLKNKNWIKNTDNDKVTWTGIKEVCVDGSQSNKIRYKYVLSADDYMTLVLRKETRNSKTPILHKAYVGSIAIRNEKYKDLNSLCNSLIIPTKYHNFFRNLTHARDVSHNNDSD